MATQASWAKLTILCAHCLKNSYLTCRKIPISCKHESIRIYLSFNHLKRNYLLDILITRFARSVWESIWPRPLYHGSVHEQ